MYTTEELDSFLKLGYFLNYKNPHYSFDYSNIDKNRYKGLLEEDLMEIGSNLFMDAIEQRFENNKKHVVPLSAGLDSRAVLAGLLEFTETKNIYTYTFGTPGSLDFDIGNIIAEYVGTNHTKIPLTDYDYNLNEMIDISKRIGYQTMLFHHPDVQMLDKFYGGSIIWSGFLGDGLTDDKHVKNIGTPDFYYEFLEVERYQSKVELAFNSSDFNLLPYINLKDNIPLTDFENLVFENRQLKLNAPHVLMEGFEYKTPFLNKEIIDFYLSIDNSYRSNQYLYKKILQQDFPDLFSLPTKSNLGLPLGTGKLSLFKKRVENKIKRKFNKKFVKDRNVNYLNFDIAIGEKEDLTTLIKENIHDLYKRDIINWLDVRKIYRDHINKNNEYGKALLLLASLEIHLKAQGV